MSDIYKRIFEGNKKWVNETLKNDPNFFEKLSYEQKPPILWIGCSDSRVPANEITGTKPGEVFVHRNIANMVVHSDMNMLSVLDYAVNILEVKHVIVCGHYGCGGVLAAMRGVQVGLVDNWIRHIKDVYRLHQKELDDIKNDEERGRRFVELNAMEQVYDLSKTSIVQNAWRKGKPLALHGLVYDLKNGFLKDLDITIRDNKDLPSFYVLNKTETL